MSIGARFGELCTHEEASWHMNRKKKRRHARVWLLSYGAENPRSLDASGDTDKRILDQNASNPLSSV